MSNSSKGRSLWALEWLNFFLADVQTGLGPFLAAYLAANGWTPSRVGFALTLGGLFAVACQTPAGATVDSVHRKRALLGVSLAILVTGAILLMGRISPIRVYSAQVLIGVSGAFLAPTVAAVTLGIVGPGGFDTQFGRNQAFNSAGNVFTALLAACASYKFGYHAIFIIAALLALPTAVSLAAIDGGQIDYAQSRGSTDERAQAEGLSALLRDHTLLVFLAAVFLFHAANAAMLPQLGEMLAKGKPKAAAPFMSACIIVTQLVIAATAAAVGKRAATAGRRSLLLFGFAVLPLRGILYTLTHSVPALIAIQTLDGVANAIFVVVSILVIKDLTQGTGRFNIAAGALATMVGTGAAVSTSVGGLLIQHAGYRASFLGLAFIALVAFALLWFAVPETQPARNATHAIF